MMLYSDIFISVIEDVNFFMFIANRKIVAKMVTDFRFMKSNNIRLVSTIYWEKNVKKCKKKKSKCF